MQRRAWSSRCRCRRGRWARTGTCRCPWSVAPSATRPGRVPLRSIACRNDLDLGRNAAYALGQLQMHDCGSSPLRHYRHPRANATLKVLPAINSRAVVTRCLGKMRPVPPSNRCRRTPAAVKGPLADAAGVNARVQDSPIIWKADQYRGLRQFGCAGSVRISLCARRRASALVGPSRSRSQWR
jgi:hypothetical protein